MRTRHRVLLAGAVVAAAIGVSASPAAATPCSPWRPCDNLVTPHIICSPWRPCTWHVIDVCMPGFGCVPWRVVYGPANAVA